MTQALAHTPMSEAQVAIASDIPPVFVRDTSIVPTAAPAYLPQIKASKVANKIEFGDERVPAGFVVQPVGVVRRRIMWEGMMPVCKSPDGERGYGQLVDAGELDGDCNTCPMAQWTDTKPACQQQVVLAVRTLDGIPAEIVFQRTSYNDWWAVADHINKVGWDDAAFTVHTAPRSNPANNWNAINLVPTPVPQITKVVEGTAREIWDDPNYGLD